MEPVYTYANDAPKNIYADTLRAIRDIIDPSQAMSLEGLVQLCRVLQSDSERHCQKMRLFQRVQHFMRDPERQLVCDTLANGQLLPDPTGTRYGFPATGNEHLPLLADETLPEPAAVKGVAQ